MSANDAMLDAIEYISFFYPLGCSVGEVQKHLNAKMEQLTSIKKCIDFSIIRARVQIAHL